LNARWPFACFLALGLFWGAFAALIPDIKEQVGATDGELGLALLFVAVGSIPAMLVAGRLWRRFGWGLLPVGALLFAVTMLPPILATTPVTLAVAVLLFGASSGFLDVSMNAAVSDVEAARDSRLMFGAHATYSLGVFIAAIATGLAREAGYGPGPILVTVAALTAAIGLGTIATGRAVQQSGGGAVAGDVAPSAARAILFIAALSAAAFLVEDAIQNWSALHLERGLNASPALGGAAPGVYAGAMFIGRALGQPLGAYLSERALLSGGAVIAAAGVAILALAPSTLIALIGLALSGAGISTIAPALFARAGRLAGKNGRAAAIARVTSLGYSGFILGPPLVGLIAQATDLRTAIASLAVLSLVVGIGGWLMMTGDDGRPANAVEEPA
jgi:predicted MFS family arabinose efflux permease